MAVVVKRLVGNVKLNFVVEFFTKTFEKLTTNELYQMLKLRSEVFVVEQDCVYQDVDDKDQKALHVLGMIEGKLIAYSRVFDKGIYFNEASIGRVVVKQEYRKYSYGHVLIEKSIAAVENNFQQQTIKISAQAYLEKFYQKHGFITQGNSYLEDGIPHLAMYRN
ncbi:GNAT family N-acetyltransferase [Bacteroidota bacterium]